MGKEGFQPPSECNAIIKITDEGRKGKLSCPRLLGGCGQVKKIIASPLLARRPSFQFCKSKKTQNAHEKIIKKTPANDTIDR